MRNILGKLRDYLFLVLVMAWMMVVGLAIVLAPIVAVVGFVYLLALML